MSTKIKIVDRISSFSFFLGLVASKIQYLRTNTVTPFFNIASIALYLLGYSFWFLNSYFYPNQTPKYNKWYGFAAFKEQNTYAAALGIFGTLTAFVAIALPVFAIPTAWLFFTSNVLWCIGEYHKLKNPLPDENYSESYQKSYVSYAISITSVGIVSALATTLMFLFPPLYLPILIVSSLMSLAFIATSVGYWFDYTCNNHKKTPIAKQSYETMTHSFGPLSTFNKALEPYHGKDLHQSVLPKSIKKPVELANLLVSNSYSMH